MPLTRRSFLAAGAASAAVISGTTSVPRLLLQAAASVPDRQVNDDRILVVVQLGGGNDGLNTVIPCADDVYASNRFATRIAESAALKIDDYLGFHPAMQGVHRLFHDQRLSIVQGVGYANPNRSHFESMDIWHTARPDLATRHADGAGWLGRYLDASRPDRADQTHGDVAAVHLGSETQPLALAGLYGHVPSIGSFEQFQFDDVDRQELRTVRERLMAMASAGDGDLIAHVRRAAHTALSSSRRVAEAVARRAAPAGYPATDLGTKLRGIARLVEAGLSTRIYYVTLNGFDTHSLQAEAHAGLLRELSDALAAFLDDLGGSGQSHRVLVLCFSEFGRRVRENASRGTDHGAAAPVLLAGGRQRGGVLGAHPDLNDLEDGDLRFHTDFRQVYATVLEGWLGVASEPLLGDRFDLLPIFHRVDR